MEWRVNDLLKTLISNSLPARPTIPAHTVQHNTDEASTYAELKVSVEASTQLGDKECDVDETFSTSSAEPNASLETTALLGDEEGDVESPTLILTAKISLLKLDCDDSKSLSNVKDLESLKTETTSSRSANNKSKTDTTLRSKIPVRIKN